MHVLAGTLAAALPYTNKVCEDFRMARKHALSLIDFIALYSV